MQAANQTSLKEWKIVNDKVSSGEQIILIRKGGIYEQRDGFQVPRKEFFLFPTYVHQSADQVHPHLTDEFKSAADSKPEGNQVHIDTYVSVDRIWKVTELEKLRAVEELQVLNWNTIEMRFNYRNKPLLHVVSVRAFKLPEPHKTENHSDYDGCVSWVELKEPLPTAGAVPVLGESEFKSRIHPITDALAGFELPLEQED